MITVFERGGGYQYVYCLSTDIKPDTVNGALLTEMDTHREFLYDKENRRWIGKDEKVETNVGDTKVRKTKRKTRTVLQSDE